MGAKALLTTAFALNSAMGEAFEISKSAYTKTKHRNNWNERQVAKYKRTEKRRAKKKFAKKWRK